MESQQNKTFIAAALLIAGLTVGYLLGAASGAKQAEKNAEQKIKEMESSLSIFVPPLPETVNAVSGTIIQKDGDALTLQIPSLTERYPKPGKPMPTETKTVHITSETELTATDFRPKALRADGIPQTKQIQADELRAGDIISATVKENARTEQILTAIDIQKISQ